MSQVLPFSNNAITVYKYEPFSYTIKRPVDASYSVLTFVSGGLPISLFKPPSIGAFVLADVSFTSTGYNGATSAVESFQVQALDASQVNVLYSSSNNVSILPGRFTTPASNSSFTFYVNEAVTPQVFASFIDLSQILTSPTIPPGLIFTSNDICSVKLQGTPTVELPSCNYQIIGRGSLGKIVTTRVNIGIGPERVRLSISGDPVVTLNLDSPIVTRAVTATFPFQTTSNLAYTWSGLPDGLQFADLSGNTTSPLFPPDPSGTIILTGTPTAYAARQYVNAGITSNTLALTARRISSLLSNTLTFTFAFQPTVLFDSVFVPPLYTNLPVPGGISFRAKTYFGSDASITTIFSPDLRSDLSLIFFTNQQRADLSGTPLSASSGFFTIRASNANSLTRDISTSLSVSNDVVTFSTTPTDACSTFILSRPVTNPKEGYYKYPISFSATAASGRPITYTTSGLTGSGLSLTTSSNVATLSGIPEVPRSLTTLTVTATAADTGANANTSIQYSIADEVFTFTNLTPSQLTFIQNREITPIQITASTFSERNVNTYRASGLPPGLSMTTTGLVRGTTLTTNVSGTFTAFANTGYAIGSRAYDYTVTPDALILYTDQSSYSVSPGGNVDIPIRAVSFSGRSASNYALRDLSANYYGYTINSNSGQISGTLIDGIPPGTLLPVSCNYYVSAQMTNIDASLNANISTTNPIVNRSFLSAKNTTQVVPVAKYDLSNYNPITPSNIPNTGSDGGIGGAIVNLGTFNTYVAASPTYLQIYGPNIGALPTGGIQTPPVTNVRSVEMWVRLPSLGDFGQYFIDFRTGLPVGYMISSASGVNNGTDVLGATLYINGSSTTISSSTNVGQLVLGGWRHVVITFPSSFTSSLTFFSRYTFQQSMPIQVGEISVYNTLLTDMDVRALYNSKSTRYGLTPGPTITLHRADDNYSNWTRIPHGITLENPSTQIDTLPFVYRYESVDSTSNVFFLGSTSNAFTRSTDGISFTQYRYAPSSSGFEGSTVINIPSTSTWWVIGTNSSGSPVLYKSEDNALTWSYQSDVSGLITRDSNRGIRNRPLVNGNAYFMSGAELVYQDGVYLVGGLANGNNVSILRSTDVSSWTETTNSLGGETAFISTDVSGTWIATGTGRYTWPDNSSFVSPTRTIVYSSDQGENWTSASALCFNYRAYDITYACNVWLATGVDCSGGPFYHQLRYSSDGVDWSNIPVFETAYTDASDTLYPLSIRKPIFDGSNWRVMKVSNSTISLYTHDATSDFTSNWTSNIVTGVADLPRRMLPANYVRSGTPTTCTLSFASTTGGPTITSPTSREFLLYQYIPIDPIVIELSGVGNTYALVVDDDLPAGLVYNPVTRTISGTPTRLGDDSLRVFVEDDTGISSTVFIFHVILPSFLRRQTSASAYTSYVRQYTLVNAAQNSRDNVALPAGERSLGEFTAPPPPDVVSAVVCKK